MSQTASQVVVSLAAALILALEAGCTFVTSCPANNNNNNNPSGGAGGGGNPNGGNAGSAPVPMGTWRNVTSNLAKMPSECGNMSGMFVKPDEDIVIAGIALHGLWASRDGADTWDQMGTGSGSDEIVNRPTSVVFDPSDSNRFWESGIYHAGVFETKDDGDTFTSLGLADGSDLLSVDLSDPKRKTLLAGGHEATNTLWRSTNGGLTWAESNGDLPAAASCTFPLLIDSRTYLVGCATPGGIYRSTDSGSTWTSVAKSGGGAAPLRASDGSIYWSSTSNTGVARSTDDGLTWADADPSKATHTSALAELPDGRIAAFGGSHEIVVSADQGATWLPATTAVPYDDKKGFLAGFTYSAKQNAFFAWINTCGFTGSIPVPENAIMRYDFDYKVN